MIILLARAKYLIPKGRPAATSPPVGTYMTLLLVGALWVAMFVALLVDWPRDSSGYEISKRYDPFEGVQDGATEGPAFGCLAMDIIFASVLFISSLF